MSIIHTGEGVRTRDLIELMGRNDSGSFYGKDYSELSAIKQEERRKVADFILRYFTGVGPKVLSMPGTSWAFELALIAARPQTHIVGVESSATVYQHAKRAMPILGQRFIESRAAEFASVSERSRQYGRATYTYARTTANNKARKCRSAHRLLMMRMSTFLSMLVTDYGQTQQQRADFHKRFGTRNAAWLDFTGSMSREIENSLRYLPFLLAAPSYAPEPKPVVITFFSGHDHFRGTDERVEHLSTVQPLFKHIEHWTYRGKNGSPMLTVCGEIV